MEDKKDVDDDDVERNKNLAFKSEQQINVEDFEEYKRSADQQMNPQGTMGITKGASVMTVLEVTFV